MFTLLQYDGAYDAFVADAESKVKGFRASIDQRLDRLAQFGAKAGPNVTKHLRDGIYECRAQRKRQQARLLWFYLKGKRIVVAVGVIKEKKVRPGDIDRALAIKKTLQGNPELINDLTQIH